MYKRTLLSLATPAVLLAFLASSVHAQGLYLSPDRSTRERHLTTSHQGPVMCKDRKIHVEVVEAGATVQVTETFHNASRSVLEGTYVFPLPRMAAATGLSLFINGKEVQGEVLDAGKAKTIYTDIVRRARDPGLLEYIGQGLLRASIYPINPRSDVTVRLNYVASVERSGSLYNFAFPLRTSAPGDPTTFIGLNISSTLPVRNIYSPSHEIDIARAGDHAVRVTYEGRGAEEKNFSLYYALSEGEFGFSLLTHASPVGENYFMLMISPKIEVEADKVIPRDVVFVIDKSGSMKNEKWEQAKGALKYCIKSLNPEDRFGLLAFSTETIRFKDGLVPVTDASRAHAAGFLDTLSAAGGTNIHEALLNALHMLADSERLCMVAFLTDGLPTIGVTNLQQIIRDVDSANRKNLRIFNFGVGYDVNTYLLDILAENSRGASDYIEEGENIEVKVSSFYSKISDPVLSDVKLVFEGVKPHDLYPKNLEDLFAGSALTVVGKLEELGKGSVVLCGNVHGKEQRFEFTGDFTPSTGARHDFLPQYFAMRKIGYLLNQIRLHGLSAEIKDEVITLGRRYGLVTPYTSALVVEEGARLARAANVQNDGNTAGSSGFLSGRGRKDVEDRLRRLAGGPTHTPGAAGPTSAGPSGPASPGLGGSLGPRGATTGGLGRKRSGGYGGAYRGPGDGVPPNLGGSGDSKPPSSPRAAAGPSSPGAPKSGKENVREAKNLNRLARKGTQERLDLRQVIHVGSLSFHRIGKLLVDSRFQEEMRKKCIKIEVYSEAYFTLLADHPELKKLFALGEHIIFLLEGKAYEVLP